MLVQLASVSRFALLAMRQAARQYGGPLGVTMITLQMTPVAHDDKTGPAIASRASCYDGLLTE
ncbi:hypothetical protein [Streptomyces purpurascens]|uniref:hypothetical protein n=1 Tax=Streptomyces purpurascens TaxID=1924 RepID=UPI003C2ECE1F